MILHRRLIMMMMMVMVLMMVMVVMMVVIMMMMISEMSERTFKGAEVLVLLHLLQDLLCRHLF